MTLQATAKRIGGKIVEPKRRVLRGKIKPKRAVISYGGPDDHISEVSLYKRLHRRPQCSVGNAINLWAFCLLVRDQQTERGARSSLLYRGGRIYQSAVIGTSNSNSGR